MQGPGTDVKKSIQQLSGTSHWDTLVEYLKAERDSSVRTMRVAEEPVKMGRAQGENGVLTDLVKHLDVGKKNL